LVSILWTRFTLQNWRAKLISLLLAATVWYLIKKNIAPTSSPSEDFSAAAVSQTRAEGDAEMLSTGRDSAHSANSYGLMRPRENAQQDGQ
jgi:hypothetical protein